MSIEKPQEYQDINVLIQRIRDSHDVVVIEKLEGLLSQIETLENGLDKKEAVAIKTEEKKEISVVGISEELKSELVRGLVDINHGRLAAFQIFQFEFEKKGNDVRQIPTRDNTLSYALPQVFYRAFPKLLRPADRYNGDSINRENMEKGGVYFVSYQANNGNGRTLIIYSNIGRDYSMRTNMVGLELVFNSNHSVNDFLETLKRNPENLNEMLKYTVEFTFGKFMNDDGRRLNMLYVDSAHIAEVENL